MKFAVVILTYNSERRLPALFDGIAKQTRQPDEIIVMDSNSWDSSRQIAEDQGARVYVHGSRKFNHGGTRRWASQETDADFLIYLTDDAVPADPFSFANIIDALDGEPDAGMAFGRQLPHPEAGALGRHHRLFNYPADSKVKRLVDAKTMGIKTCYASDSFSAYRRDRLIEVGGFPENLVSCEDVFVSARLLLSGYAVVYAGNARVFHSHDYTISDEFRRYFDLGAFFSMNPWVMQNFGGASGEGVKFVRSQILFLLRSGKWHLLFKAVAAMFAKFIGFNVGLRQRHLPSSVKRKLGMYGAYWT